jgi:CubicO group peptidase (beta-lactamase class C family)
MTGWKEDTMQAVQGHVEPSFAAVKDALEEQFASGEHIGAGVCVYHRGRKVVDIWGGLADEDAGEPWRADTLALSYSTTKGLAATCLHILADRGLVDYEAPVARYWPEFAQNGKDEITVYHVLTHQAGLPQVPEGLHGPDLFDWERVIRGIEEEPPVWKPGTESGYHALTFGFLVGEVVRRVSGKRIGAFLRDEVCTPLGIAEDMFIGAPESAERRIAKLKNRIVMTPELMEQFQAMRTNPDPLRARALGMRPNEGVGAAGVNHFDTREGHRAEVPAANGIMTAGALARLYACLAGYGELDGVRVLTGERVRLMSQRQTLRPDRIIVVPVGYALGYMTGGTEGWPQGPRVTAFGHAGLGGSIGYCDPEIGLAFGLTVNALAMDLIGYGRTARLADAARQCAEALA